MYKIILVILIGVFILTAESIYFCNKCYISEIVDDNYIMKIKSSPSIQDKIIVGFFTVTLMVNIILLGWFTYRDQRKKVTLESRTLSRHINREDIDY